jgi:hypothetical protein
MVLGDVPKGERCRCHEQPAGRASAPAAKAGSAVPSSDESSSNDSAVLRFKAWLKR